MGRYRSDHSNRIHAVVLEHLVEVLRLADAREAPAKRFEELRPQIAHPSGLRRGCLVEDANEVWPPVTESNDPDAHPGVRASGAVR